MIIVADTTPISELAKIGNLDLLQQIYGQITIPKEVYQEITTGNHPAVNLINSVNWLNICSVGDSEKVSKLQQITQLDLGESAAIILAEELGANIILIDDLAARKVAISRSLSVTGTVGTLLTAKQLGIVNYVKPLLDALINQGTRISPQLYQQVLAITQEL